jgi:phage terminase Nu1 subunit (DNA packaging protein)
MPPAKPRPLTLTAYAAHRKAAGLSGGSVQAVQQARDSGRLVKSLTEDGRISSADAADAEWAANTKAHMRPHTGPSGTDPGANIGRPRKSKGEALAYADSIARKAAADAGLAELKLAKERGELVCVAVAERKLTEAFAACKTKLLGVHARARQRDPGLTQDQVALFEALVREALSDLAGTEEDAP